MGWLGDGSHRGQGCQVWTAAGLLPRYPHSATPIHGIWIPAAKLADDQLTSQPTGHWGPTFIERGISVTSRLICPGSPIKWCQGCKQHNFNSRRRLSWHDGCGWHLLASNFAKKKQRQAAVVRWQCRWYWTECCRFISYQRRRQVHANWTGSICCWTSK